jgi:hypothetical protein
MEDRQKLTTITARKYRMSKKMKRQKSFSLSPGKQDITGNMQSISWPMKVNLRQ